jgi:bacillithiol system protein YtxJ
MNWNILDSQEKLEAINRISEDHIVLIFKHSRRCSTSSMVLDRLERNWKESETKELKAYFLDLIAYRDLSDQIAEMYDVIHESPQVLLISKGKCIYDASHTEISYHELIDVAL